MPRSSVTPPSRAQRSSCHLRAGYIGLGRHRIHVVGYDDTTMSVSIFQNLRIRAIAHPDITCSFELDSRLTALDANNNMFVQIVIGQKTWAASRGCRGFTFLDSTQALPHRAGLRRGHRTPLVPNDLLPFQVLRDLVGTRQVPGNPAVNVFKAQGRILLLNSFRRITLFEARYDGVEHDATLAYTHHTMFVNMHVRLTNLQDL